MGGEKGGIDYYSLELDDEVFELFRSLILRESGIHVGRTKRLLLKNRLRRILMERGLASFKEYYLKLISSPDREAEIALLLDSVTTTKSCFFRERRHLDYFVRELIPRYLEQLEAGARTRVDIWSAGCATGEEVYSMAMVVAEKVEPPWNLRFRIVGSDINTCALAAAREGIYDERKLDSMPLLYRRKYMEETDDGRWKVCASVRKMVRFRQVNLVRCSTWGTMRYDLILCKNVLVYMEEAARRRIVEGFHRSLMPEGFLAVGLSENLGEYSSLFEFVIPSLYRRKEAFGYDWAHR